MTLQDDAHPAIAIDTVSATGTSTGTSTGTGEPFDSNPPTPSKITAGLAALACAACCALPFLIAAGVLTGAGAAVAEKVLLAASAVLLAAAGVFWHLKRRRSALAARVPAADNGCGNGNCAC